MFNPSCWWVCAAVNHKKSIYLNISSWINTSAWFSVYCSIPVVQICICRSASDSLLWYWVAGKVCAIWLLWLRSDVLNSSGFLTHTIESSRWFHSLVVRTTNEFLNCSFFDWWYNYHSCCYWFEWNVGCYTVCKFIAQFILVISLLSTSRFKMRVIIIIWRFIYL